MYRMQFICDRCKDVTGRIEGNMDERHGEPSGLHGVTLTLTRPTDFPEIIFKGELCETCLAFFLGSVGAVKSSMEIKNARQGNG